MGFSNKVLDNMKKLNFVQIDEDVLAKSSPDYKHRYKYLLGRDMLIVSEPVSRLDGGRLSEMGIEYVLCIYPYNRELDGDRIHRNVQLYIADAKFYSHKNYSWFPMQIFTVPNYLRSKMGREVGSIAMMKRLLKEVPMKQAGKNLLERI